ncbi:MULTISPECIES: precorrin-6A synthase (deacetylating) [unclassified Acidocella]|uniref:precorrin-6A synthase (deacetylating) n=1 Tax=unclassified Acidocella TaxID=2648610 RepID=UPI00028E5B81|nr:MULTISPECIES: precorrin-6A synthase (deacetylating) [unclassified Acidocella]EKM98270.1 precorrin 6A synthase [Acidocella sp. MX-AZ02]WBO59369.1 precorrin-6A synthase (deacetylating) [Acidocella sp. MX-AZ03]
MHSLVLIGIGTGNPDHLTLQAIKALNAADIVMIPRKGAQKADLAALRRRICDEVITNQATRLVEFDLPVRDEATPDYRARVEDWHDEIARRWRQVLERALPQGGRAALLVWGDPSLYDSTLRIAGRLALPVEVIPGITSIQALTAAHAMVLNEIGAPFLVTTGRQLRDHGWPPGVDTLVVMLDGGCAFQSLDPAGIWIWWGAYLGMPEQIIRQGALARIGPEIIATRAAARAAHGWIMDVYLLRKTAG